MKKVMVDSNILFSGLLFKGKPSQVLNTIRRKKLTLVLSDDQIDEIYRVFEREVSEKVYLLDIFFLLTKINFVDRSKYSNLLKSTSELIRDKKDMPILACAIAIKPKYFITGDRDFCIKEIKQKINVVTPDEFLRRDC